MLRIHPLGRCNLSSPPAGDERDALPVELLENAVRGAARLGWRTLVVSGGEPLLYAPLGMLLARARGVGLRTAILTNGTLLRRVPPIAELLDRVDIGLDGLGERHDTMRGHPGAFAALMRGLPWLRDAGVPFGFVFTLTRHNLHELPEVARFAVAQGAAVLQIHPLAAAGRGALLGSSPGDEDAARAWLDLWQIAADDLPIRVELDFADLERMGAPGAALWEVPSPLVIETDGTVVPLQHGFPREWALGSLHAAPLAELVQRWPKREAFRELCAATLRRRTEEVELPFLDVVQAVVDAAQGVATPA